MKRNSLLICLFAVLFLSSCGGRSKTASALANGDTIPLRYAENLTLMSYPGYTLATLRNPWDTLHTLHTYILVPKDRELPAHLPAGTVVRTPLSNQSSTLPSTADWWIIWVCLVASAVSVT